MKKLTLVALAVLALVVLAPSGAFAQSASASSDANANILTAISIANNLSLEFGNIAACGTASVVRVTPAGARSVTSGCAVAAAGGTVRAADFTVSGDATQTYAITLPASATLTSGVNTMTVDTFASTPSGTGTIGAGGTQTLTVGADLHVGVSQAAGAYAGTFSVSVVYN
jgi:hypothetical protein